MNEQNRAALMPTLIFFGGLTLILVALLATQPAAPRVSVSPTSVSSSPTSQPTAEVVIAVPTAAPTAQTVAVAALDPAAVKAGENIFQSVCFACHGFNAMGIPGLGKTLIGSEFVNSQTDEQLVAFLNVGRAVTDPLNTTGVLMPPKGGNPGLTDADLENVITYIRSLNGGSSTAASTSGTGGSAQTAPTVAPTEVVSGPTSVPATFSAIDTSGLAAPTSVAMADTSSNTTNSFANPGAPDYVRACAGCHGMNGEGQYLLTKPLADSEMVKSMNSIAILDLFNRAQPPTNPDIQFQHPYRGDYLELRDDQLLSIITYLFTLRAPGS